MSVIRPAVFACLPLLGLAAAALAQMSPNPAAPTPSQSNQNSAAVPQVQMTPPSSSGLSGAGPFEQSIPSGPATSETLNLTLQDAVARGLKQNLGLYSSQESTRSATAARLRALNALLPNINGQVSETSEQVNLAAFGFTGLPIPGFTNINPIVGPFQVFDARAYLSQRVLDLNAIRNTRSAGQLERAANFTFRDARDTVVLVVVGLYLQAIAGAARVDSQQAQLDTATALLKLAQDQKTAGVVPGIDVLRAQVEQQSQQQRLIALQNDFEKQKLSIARAIGLPLGQPFRLAETLPYSAVPPIPLEDALQQAYANRADYQAAQARVRAAEENKRAAQAERYPTASVDANYGAIGQTVPQARGTYTVTGSLRIPIYQGTKVKADVLEADSQLSQRRAEADSLRGQIDNEVRAAFLDTQSANKQVQVAQQNVDLARQTLTQAQDRFRAGVTNNIEVIQAQEALAAANENLISAMYQFNVAKATLVRAIGGTNDAIQSVVRGNRQ